MTAITKSFHTHAQGEYYGWWARAVHPAHLDDNGQFIQGTEWEARVVKASSLAEAERLLEGEIVLRLGIICGQAIEHIEAS